MLEQDKASQRERRCLSLHQMWWEKKKSDLPFPISVRGDLTENSSFHLTAACMLTAPRLLLWDQDMVGFFFYYCYLVKVILHIKQNYLYAFLETTILWASVNPQWLSCALIIYYFFILQCCLRYDNQCMDNWRVAVVILMASNKRLFLLLFFITSFNLETFVELSGKTFWLSFHYL